MTEADYQSYFTERIGKIIDAGIVDFEDSVEPEYADYESMTVTQLQELLRKQGKTVSGKKADLIARISE